MRLSQVQNFFSSYRFPAIALALLGAFELLLIVMLAVPSAPDGLGAFAEEFRVWCFGYDTSTGTMEWAYVAMMAAHPIVIGGLIAFVWWQPLREVVRTRPRALVPYLAGSLLTMVVASSTLLLLRGEASAAELPFPADALRTKLPAPEFSLENQDGQPVSLADLSGSVVILTGVYATCGHTCPLIMAQLERALAALAPEDRSQVRVVAVTLNPKHDTRQVLLDLANRHEVSAPDHQFLTGSEADVNRLLDQLQIARTENPMSGVIDHANLFIVLDRQTRIAYRFTLGERQERWLTQAVSVLAREAPARAQ
jgi:protein SCO1